MIYIRVNIGDFHPTQITIWMAEVKKKQKHIEALTHEQLHIFREEHIIPAVIGPEGKYYILDHHHMVLALELSGHEHAYCKVMKDLSTVEPKIFWKKMSQARWIHPYDENGKKKPVTEIPKRVQDLKDDPYRSLAACVREKQVFKKTFAPYAEFEWADFFRKHIAPDFVQGHFEEAVYISMGLADSAEAKHLSGWTWTMINTLKKQTEE